MTLYTSLQEFLPKFYTYELNSTKITKFEDYLTGHILEEAYIINNKYGSFYDPVIAVTFIRRAMDHLDMTEELGQKLLKMIIADTKQELFSLTVILNEPLITKETFDEDGRNLVSREFHRHIRDSKLHYQKFLKTPEETQKLNNTPKRKTKRNNNYKNFNFYYVSQEKEKNFENQKVPNHQVVSLEKIFGPGSEMSIHSSKPNQFMIILSNGDKEKDVNLTTNYLLAKYSEANNVVHRGDACIISKSDLFN